MKRCPDCGLALPIFWPPKARCADTEGCQERIVAQFADTLARTPKETR